MPCHPSYIQPFLVLRSCNDSIEYKTNGVLSYLHTRGNNSNEVTLALFFHKVNFISLWVVRVALPIFILFYCYSVPSRTVSVVVVPFN